MPGPTRRQFVQRTAALLPLAFTRALPAAEIPAANSAAGETGTLPRGVDHVPRTPFDAPAGSWSLVAIPDSQHDAAFYPEVFQRQMEWIAAHKDSHRIRMALHEGDVTDDNGLRQWGRIRKSRIFCSRTDSAATASSNRRRPAGPSPS